MGITFSLSGTIKNTEIKKLLDVEACEYIDVSDKSSKEIVQMLNSKKYLLSLEEATANSEENDVDIFDYEADD